MKSRAAWLLLVLAWAGVAHADSRLARLGGPTAEAQLASPEVEARLRAVAALGRVDGGEPVAATRALVARLQLERDDDVRRAILRAIARRRQPQGLDALVSRLRTPAEHHDATLLLAAFDGPRAIAALVERTSEPLRNDAVIALERIGPGAIVPLTAALREPVQAVGAARALGAIADARATPDLVRLLGSRDAAARVAACEALGMIADERARPAMLAALRDADPVVVAACVGALGRAGRAEDAGVVVALTEQRDRRVSDPALDTLARLDPARAVVVLGRALASDVLDERERASRVLLAMRDPVAVPLLASLLGAPASAPDAASALASIEGGAGLAALVRGTESDDVAVVRAASVGLALLVRRFEGRVERARLGEARHALRVAIDRDDPARALVLRALARDPFVTPWIARALASSSPPRRSAAATAAELFGDSELGPLVAAALGRERSLGSRDPEPRRRMLSALATLTREAVRVGSPPPAGVAPSPRDLADPDSGPEAITLVGALAHAGALPEGPTALALGRAIRVALRAPSARARAAAARALAALGGPTVWRPLAAALSEDEDAFVRLAIARALGVLAPPAADADLCAALAVERDRAVARTLTDALAAARGLAPPLPAELSGTEPFDVTVAAGAGDSPPPLDLVLPDGRWLRFSVPASGELFVPDLPAGELDVRFPILP